MTWSNSGVLELILWGTDVLGLKPFVAGLSVHAMTTWGE
jgi:hypothetical protein